MTDPTRALFGTAEAQAETTLLQAGPVSAVLEAGGLRWIRYDGVEIIRAIAFLVRDDVWDTAESVIDELRIEKASAGFSIRVSAVARTSAGDLPWRAAIDGDVSGRIRFEAVATPQADFTTNRTGFVVLHPLDGVAGEPVVVTSADGKQRHARFPLFVDPEPCFTDVRALRHRVSGDIWALCEMEGEDSWETEDHRNWLDASFKTYVRPLRLPYPYVLEAGRAYRQSVTLSFSQPLPERAPARRASTIEITLGEPSGGSMPAIGLDLPASSMEANFANAPLAWKAGIQSVHGRVDPRVDRPDTLIGRYAQLGADCNAKLVLEIVAPCRRDIETELSEIAGLLRDEDIRPESVLIVPAEDKIRVDPGPPAPPLALLVELYSAARKCFPGTLIGGGTLGWFAELNRNWPPLGLIDYVAYTASSLVHAADDQTLIENLESFGHQARTVKALAGNMPLRVAASGIALRPGSFSATVANTFERRTTMASFDPRQRGLFGAAWTLGSLIEMAASGIAEVVPAALSGGSGMVDERAPAAPPRDGVVSRPVLLPLYHVVAGIAAVAGNARVAAHSADPHQIKAIACKGRDGGVTLWLANISNQAQIIRFSEKRPMLAQVLDLSTVERATSDPQFLSRPREPLDVGGLELGAYGVAHIQIEG